MTEIVMGFLSDLLRDGLTQFDLYLTNMLRNIFYIENFFTSTFSASMVSNVYNVIYYFMLSLLAAKFLHKGFQIYILWRNGDADNSPQDMFIGAGQAVVFSLCFPYLYDKLTEVTLWFAGRVMNAFTLSQDLGLRILVDLLTNMGILQVILLLIYFILSIVLYIKLIERGVELFIIRLGFPVFCLGLLDSDYGVFQPIVQTLYKTMLTSIIQICLFSFSLRIILDFNILNAMGAFAFLSVAYKTPTILQNMLIPTSGGGGGMTKVYQSAQLGRMLFSMVKR